MKKQYVFTEEEHKGLIDDLNLLNSLTRSLDILCEESERSPIELKTMIYWRGKLIEMSVVKQLRNSNHLI